MVSFANKPKPAASLQDVLASQLASAELLVKIDETELAELRLNAQKTGQAEGLALGHSQGHAEGLREGHAAGLAEVKAQANQLKALALTLPAALQLAQSSVADELLALALDIARKVLGQALATEPRAILAAVQELLQAEPCLTGGPQLLVHPDDAALVKELLADDLKAAGWSVRIDAQIARGGCRVTAHSGERDATIQARWERVCAALARHPGLENLEAVKGTEPI
jgi:flagellar assembly protein FliH